jgi:hypothetical protein
MVEVPDLVQNSAIAITAEIWNSASLGVKGSCDLGEGICRCIGGKNSCTIVVEGRQQRRTIVNNNTLTKRAYCKWDTSGRPL